MGWVGYVGLRHNCGPRCPFPSLLVFISFCAELPPRLTVFQACCWGLGLSTPLSCGSWMLSCAARVLMPQTGW